MSQSPAQAYETPAHVSRKQVMSLLGLVPLSLYVIAHLFSNMYSVLGADAFDAHLRWTRDKPVFLVFEIVGLFIPLIAHTVMGAMEIGRSRPNNLRYPTMNNLQYILQRVTAIGLLLFLCAHVIKARILPALGSCEGGTCMNLVNGNLRSSTMESWAGMHAAFSQPDTLIVYALGLLGISFHLANGYYTAAMRWGLVISESGRRRMFAVAVVFMIALLGMSAVAVLGFQPFGLKVFGA